MMDDMRGVVSCHWIQKLGSSKMLAPRRSNTPYTIGPPRHIEKDVVVAEGVYKLTRWMKPRQRLQPPPIQVGDRTYSTEIEKAMALRKEKLERRDDSDDISDAWQPAVNSTKEIPFARTISTKEIEKAVLHTGNTTPGSDGITTKMLQVAWSDIARPLTTLYNACLRLGHHPSVFKAAEWS
ncbi:hypothetical protein NQ176_g3924 [Zarea fungicola]|uniref:Uncharacterized protein n=1 Tax=Zarea fungicola TaxID=93591 RepID=A0ACC1NGR7_9HYPO|nr:hypothetical protein NQ176_g3924 [Lecanicillium fungicola]